MDNTVNPDPEASKQTLDQLLKDEALLDPAKVAETAQEKIFEVCEDLGKLKNPTVGLFETEGLEKNLSLLHGQLLILQKVESSRYRICLC